MVIFERTCTRMYNNEMGFMSGNPAIVKCTLCKSCGLFNDFFPLEKLLYGYYSMGV